jgi:Tfp pilus assembly protein PilV
MPILNVALVILALVGMLALGRLLARALEAVDEAKASPPPLQLAAKKPDLYHRLMRALIEGPEDRR